MNKARTKWALFAEPISSGLLWLCSPARQATFRFRAACFYCAGRPFGLSFVSRKFVGLLSGAFATAWGHLATSVRRSPSCEWRALDSPSLPEKRVLRARRRT